MWEISKKFQENKGNFRKIWKTLLEFYRKVRKKFGKIRRRILEKF